MLGWSWADAAPRTARELMLAYDARMLHDWDQTALLAALSNGIITTLCNINLPKGKSPLKVKEVNEFHPYRSTASSSGESMKITPNTVWALQIIGDNMVDSS